MSKERAERLKEFKYVVPIEEAMGWRLYKDSLRGVLTDKAVLEAEAIGVLADDEDDNEYAKIVVEGANFVVTFVPAEETPNTDPKP